MSEHSGDPTYGTTLRLPGQVESTIPKVREVLATEGFGVLTEIDVRATLKKKLDVDFRPYVILGACHPPSAHQALCAEPGVGLLLPCNVVVAQQGEGQVVVSAVDPERMLGVVGRAEIEPLAREVGRKLRAALARLGEAS